MCVANNSLKAEQRFFVEFVPTEQIGVIAEISQQPAEPPECFGCAIDAASESMAMVLFWFENRQAQEVKRSSGMPAIERPIHSDKEGTFKLIGAVSAFAMQAWNMACHELTSEGVA